MSELEQRANEAWLAMQRDVRPMPPGVAIDYAQDVCGDRDDAVSAILTAAAVYLDPLRPEPADSTSADMGAAIAARGYLLGESWTLAGSCLDEIDGRSRQVIDWIEEPDDGAADVLGLDQRSHELACAWLRWCAYTRGAIETCRAISAAAYPEPQPETA